jgi:hypothetical protein
VTAERRDRCSSGILFGASHAKDVSTKNAFTALKRAIVIGSKSTCNQGLCVVGS